MTKISLRPRAIEGLKIASEEYRRRLNETLDILKHGSFPPHTKKLGGKVDGYRTRVGGWRILFIINDSDIDVVDIFLKKGRDDYRRRKF